MPVVAAALAGAFCAVTLSWIVWGVLTPGDYFANGSVILYPSLLLAAIAGAWLAHKSHTRIRIGALAAITALCVLFWVATPDGWWAKPLPGSHSPGAPPHH
jgi:hypothetical protein